jgi:ABC-type microcin C transport system permease subunit YejB
LKRLRLPFWIGDVLVALLVIGLLAAGAFGSWKLFQGLTTSCIRARYGNDCLPDEPWSYAFSMLATALGAMAALGSATFITYLRVRERP